MGRLGNVIFVLLGALVRQSEDQRGVISNFGLCQSIQLGELYGLMKSFILFLSQAEGGGRVARVDNVPWSYNFCRGEVSKI